jgi:hypothetical protein
MSTTPTDLARDAATVRRIAHDNLGPGADAKRAARERRKAAILTCMAATSRGERPTSEQLAEEAAAMAAYREAR